jgi:hypothetical protein
MSESKPRRQRRDKLPLSEKHARRLEASRRYYLRYFNFFLIRTCHLLFSRNQQRIREEQRVRSRLLVIQLIFIRICTSFHGCLLPGIVKSCKWKNNRKTSLKATYVFVLTAVDNFLERMKMGIVIPLLTQTL